MTNRRYRIFKMFLHISYACNMSCRGCVTLNDTGRGGVEPYESLVESWTQWSRVLDPEHLLLFGGEPLMHPQFKELCQLARKLWPNTRIMIPTNALLLKSIMDREWVDSIKPVNFRISLHSNSTKDEWFKSVIKDFMSIYPNWRNSNEPLTTTHLKPNRFDQHHDNVYISVCEYDEFIVPYTFDQAGNIAPYNNDPVQAFEQCVSEENIYIYKDRLWKCLPYPNLRDTQADFDARWPHYEPYKSTDDLTPFFDELSKPNAICSMCPTREDHQQAKVLHSKNTQAVKILPKAKWLKTMINK